MDAASPPQILHLIDRIAARAVIHLDDMTLGQHPDATAREAGELALLDWTVAGGAVVSHGPEAVAKLLAQLTALAHSPAAEEALARETHGRMEIFRAEVETHGAGVAELRLRARQRGEDPDRPVVTE